VKLAVCQLPTNLTPEHPAWTDYAWRLERAQTDLAVMNEMPFGEWLAARPHFDASVAQDSVELHESALPVLRNLPCAVLASRPIHGKNRLCNEAFLMAERTYRPVHQKQYFPQEEGFYEHSWFTSDTPGFEVTEFRGVRIGVLLCTELMFTEWARHYRRLGAHVIVAPRASGKYMRPWDASARMAAIVSGCYVVSSNRVSEPGTPGQVFGGRGFVYAPGGELLGETSDATPLLRVTIDTALVAEAQRSYPCNVRELEPARAE
jgi:N-carbamoylputrescine amidase